VAKRCFDLLGATLALLLLWPLLLVVAVLVKFDSPGPVFFRQTRVGQHGVPFEIHKFRTMQHGAPGLQITVGADARITRCGAWLRRTRIDELPQFIDVLQGSMSLVGPRPEVPRYVALYPTALRERILAMRPGITDPASLRFMNEAATLAAADDAERHYVEVILPAKLQHAADYADRATLGSDARVLWHTALRLVRRD
jgi:lipopolysaccharide/colanic/teichoic acid biosynthesis glycosyltransferase